MKGISRRTRMCAAVAVTGVAVLAGSGVAQAQSEGRQRTGDGIPTGQIGTQMFNYGGYISNGGNAAAASSITGVSAGCQATNTPSQAVCARERLEGLFRMFQRRGVTNIELFGHNGFPATTVNTTLNQAAAAGATAVRLAATANYLPGDTLRVDTGTNLESVTIASIITPAPASPEPNVTLTAPLTKAHAAGVAASYFNKRGLEEYRALMDKYGIHAGGAARLRERERLGRHGRRRQDPRRRLPRLRRHARPGHRQLRERDRDRRDGQPARQVRGGERRRSRLHPQPPAGVPHALRRQRRAQDRVADLHGAHRRALRRGRDRRLLGLGRVRRRDRHGGRGADQPVPDQGPPAAHQGRRQHRADAERHGVEHPVDAARLRPTGEPACAERQPAHERLRGAGGPHGL